MQPPLARLHVLPGASQTLLEVRELFRDDGALLVREGELCQQLERTLIGQSRAIEVPPLRIIIAKGRGIQMPTDDGDLRLEMFEAPEFLHGAVLVYRKLIREDA